MTSYARCYLWGLLCFAFFGVAVLALGLAFDLIDAGASPWVVGILPASAFLVAVFCAYRAEKNEPDPLPPCLVRMP